MENLIPVTLTIADRTYRIKVDASQEEATRKTAKFLNDKIKEFKTHYSGKDMQDYVTMALLWFATEKGSQMALDVMQDDLKDGFDRLDGLLDKALASFGS